MVEPDGAEVVMGFHGLSPGAVAFSSRAFILNSEVRVTVACGVVCVFGFSAREFHGTAFCLRTAALQ